MLGRAGGVLGCLGGLSGCCTAGALGSAAADLAAEGWGRPGVAAGLAGSSLGFCGVRA